MPERLRRLAAMAVAAMALWAAAAAPALGAAKPWIGVRGNELVNRQGETVRLLGVNRAGSESACLHGTGFFLGPDTGKSIEPIVGWGANAVRIPLNESCWLGINGVPAGFGGTPYREAIRTYVNRLERHGLYVILDLQWAAPGSHRAESLVPMPDADHAPEFWASLASEYRNDRGVLFDLFNEPKSGFTWECWELGCEVEDPLVGRYQAVGMAELVATIRATGARQPILVPGTEYAHNLGGWLAHLPADPAHALVVSTHTYDFSVCYHHCRDVLVYLSHRYPVVTDEMGETDCAHGYIDGYMRWADRYGISYLGWAWTTGPEWSCEEGPSLIRNYLGAPTEYGIGLREHLRALARAERRKRRGSKRSG